jgi:hypothetical protein
VKVFRELPSARRDRMAALKSEPAWAAAALLDP